MLSIRTLRWISVIVPTAFVVVFEFVTRSLYGDLVPAWGHTVVILAAVSIGAFAFSTFVFATMSHLEREVRERSRRLALLNTVAAEAGESLDLDEVAAIITRNVKQTMNAEGAGVALVSQGDGELRLVGQSGLHPDIAFADGHPTLKACECQQAVVLGQTVAFKDAHQVTSCDGVLRTGDAAACVSVPIRSKGNGIGVVFVVRRKSLPFSPGEVDLLTALATHVGPALQNAQMFSKTGAIAVLQERQRVAREVHDGLAQTLGYLNMQMGIVERLLASSELEKAQAELESMTSVTREAYQDISRSIMDLRTPLSQTGLRRTLREYVEQFSQRTGMTCHFEGHRGSAAVLPPDAEVQLIRIVQEALANVKKHAPDAEVWLEVEASDREVRVEVRDDGTGFDPASVAPSGRFGLQTMKERAESVGGNVLIESRPGAGTRVEITIPVEGVKAS